MRLTKLEHAALVVEDSGDRLYVDPGKFTTPITESAGTVAVVITHEHDDHWTPEQLGRIVAANPDVRIFGPAGVAAAASGFPVETVAAGDEVEVGPFRLRFFGGKHAQIHPSIPIIDNVGVLVNDALYYGGDSFVVPDGRLGRGARSAGERAVDEDQRVDGLPHRGRAAARVPDARDAALPGGQGPLERAAPAGPPSRAAASTCRSSRATRSTSDPG